MDLEALEHSPVGKLVPISGHDARLGDFSYFAFLPDPLPPSVPLSEATTATVIDAAMALGRLDIAAQRIPNPALLVRPALRKEAQSTSALEGTYAELTEVLEVEIVGEPYPPEAREILNYVMAAESGVERLKDRPISLNMLGELQKILVHRTRGDSYDAGQLRKRQVFIGSQQGPIENSRFVPPPPGDLLEKGISDWEKWIHGVGDTHLLVRVSLGHYQFEALHPFSDGNGRLGRLVIPLHLMEKGALTYPLLNIAEWLEPRMDEYLDRLFQVSVDGNFDEWVRFICLGIREQSEAAMSRIDRLLLLRDSILTRVREAGSRGGTAYRIADELVGYPLIQVPWVAKRVGVSYQAADQAVKRLVDLGLLREIRRKGRTRKLYYSHEVLRELGDGAERLSGS